MDDTPPPDTAPAPGDIVYAYKPSLMGAPFEFRLTPTALEWSKGRFTDRVPYDRIRRLRLSFRPVTMQSQRFLTEVWPAPGRSCRSPRPRRAAWSSRSATMRPIARSSPSCTGASRRPAPGPRSRGARRPILYWPGSSCSSRRRWRWPGWPRRRSSPRMDRGRHRRRLSGPVPVAGGSVLPPQPARHLPAGRDPGRGDAGRLVARMSEAICGKAGPLGGAVPGCRFAHPGYGYDATAAAPAPSTWRSAPRGRRSSRGNRSSSPAGASSSR